LQIKPPDSQVMIAGNSLIEMTSDDVHFLRNEANDLTRGQLPIHKLPREIRKTNPSEDDGIIGKASGWPRVTLARDSPLVTRHVLD
jgi:hypothetical protein